jgi:enoyl-CoA hydratase/carnithine racemase
VGAEDFSGPLAEHYGYVNRAIPDAEFDAFIDAFVSRVAGFNRRAIEQLKQTVDSFTLPPDDEFPPQLANFQAAVGTAEIQARIRRLFDKGLQKPGELEERLGELAETV